MKTEKTSPVLIAIIAALALGVGITGTMLWMENRAAPVAAPVAAPPVTSAPPVASGAVKEGELTQGGSQEPPATLTSGLSSAEAALALGNWYYDHQGWERAIQNYQNAIKSGIDNPNVRTDLGNALRFNDQPQKALEQYQIAQKQDPTHEQSLFNQGALYAVSLHNPRKGVEAWQAYLKRFPTGSSANQAKKFIAQYAKAK